nr:MAG TPA: hypothetical protein [Caudoviricetes sp.]
MFVKFSRVPLIKIYKSKIADNFCPLFHALGEKLLFCVFR